MIENKFFIEKKLQYKVNFFLILLGLLSFSLSCFKLSLSTDPTHISFMYYDAFKLAEGYIPYNEIFIVYGFLTTLLHALSILFFGEYLMSPNLITAIFYSITFYIYFNILINFKISIKYCLILIIIIFYVHPAILLPWSSYVAYFFLILSIYFYSKESTKFNFYLSGALLGCAVLSRQTYFIPIFFFLTFNLFSKRNKIEIKYLILGFIIILSLFFVYLLINNLFSDWYIATFKWPIFGIVENFHPSVPLQSNFFLKFIFLFENLFYKLFSSIFVLDLKWFFYLIVFLFNIFYIILNYKKNFFYNRKIFLIAIMSLLFFLESVHIPAIIRLSTGSVLGAITIVYVLCQNKFFLKKLIFNNNLKIILYFLLLVLIIFNLQKSYTNYQKNLNLENNLKNPKIKLLKFQFYPVNITNFYEVIDKTLENLWLEYEINYSYNFTNNSLLPLINPNIKNLQISSHYGFNGLEGFPIFDHIYKYKKNFDLNQYFKKNNLVVFQHVKSEDQIFSKDFKIYALLDYPLHETQNKLLILIPKNVLKK